MPRKLIDLLEPRRLLAILYVDWNSPIGTNDGSSWGNAFLNLHAALTAASSGDTIRVADGTYKPTTGIDRTIAFKLESGVDLYGGYGGHGAINPDARDFINTPTILSGEIGSSATDDNSYNLLNGDELAELVTIDGFIVTQSWGGDYSQRGAIKVNRVNLAVRNLNVVSNSTGINFDSNGPHELLIYDSNFSLNGIGVDADSYEVDEHKFLVENCNFTQNTGSGLSISDAFYSSDGLDGTGATIRSSHFDGNGGGGAGIDVGALVMDCTFNNNGGQGLYVYSGLVMNSEINNNGASGMYAEDGASVINTTFIQNAGNGAAWFRGLGLSNCQFIGNGEYALLQHDSDDSGGASVSGCLFAGNENGVRISGGSISRSVFIGNGRAIPMTYNTDRRTLYISNNTFFGNTAEVGSVLHYYGWINSYLYFERNIVWSNDGSPDLSFEVGPKGPEAFIEDSIIDEGYADGTNISTIDPEFIEEPSPGADNVWGTEDDDYGDLHLQEDSPALEWGYGAYAEIDEPDVTLVGNEYVVTGTDSDDTISVNRNDEYAPYVSLISFGVNGTYKSVVSEYSQSVRVNSKSGNDRVTATSGSHLVTFDGGSGNDTLTGGVDGDVLIGGEGDDVLDGGRGDDELIGGGGNDSIVAGIGNDVVNGGEDSDIINISSNQTAGSATILPSNGDDQILVGQSGNSTATAIFQGTQRINTLTIGVKGRAQIASNGNSVLTLSGLSINSLSQFDITNNSVIFDHAPNINQIFSIKLLITNGYNGGLWNGHGIVSSTSAQNARTAIAYDNSTSMFQNFPATFHGQPVDESSVIISHTFKGDVNLDRRVDFNDLLRVAQHYGSTFALWSEGDFNYDNAVNFNDLLPVAQNYNASWMLIDSTKTDRRRAIAEIVV